MIGGSDGSGFEEADGSEDGGQPIEALGTEDVASVASLASAILVREGLVAVARALSGDDAAKPQAPEPEQG